jgi:SNF2 family DNA or RNA helicase
MVEEQALCRVHRVGQKRSVTTIRYLMRDSFEEVGHSISGGSIVEYLLTASTASRRNSETEENACEGNIWN